MKYIQLFMYYTDPPRRVRKHIYTEIYKTSLNINTVVNDQSTPHTRSESYFLYLLCMELNRLSLLHEQVTNRHLDRKLITVMRVLSQV